MINTFSKFYYGYEVTSSTKYIDVDEGSGEIAVSIPVGFYSPTDLALEIQTQLNDLLTFTYTCTFSRANRTFTITSSSATDILASTGVNASAGIYSVIGFAATDLTNITTTTGSATGSVYTPQYKLQDYVDQKDNRKLRMKTKNESASGLVSVQSFGTDRVFEFSIKFATNIYQPSGSPITNNSSGVDNLRSFMQYIIKKSPIEFMPDSSTVSDYYRVVLESTSDDADGCGYKLQEQHGRGLVGYFETGILRFRIIE